MNVESTALSRTRSEAAVRWQPRAASLRVRAVASLLLLDLACIVLGFSLGAYARALLIGDSQWLLLLVATPPIYIVTAFNLHAYGSEVLQNPFRAIRRGVQSFAVAIAVVIFIAFAFKNSDNFPRLVTAIGFVVATALMAAGRWTLVRHMAQVVGGNPFSVVLICDGDQPIPEGSFSIMMAADAFDPDAHDPMMYDRLARAIGGADRVVVACPPERRLAWAHMLKGACVQGEIVVPELGQLEPLGVGEHGDAPTMVVANGGLEWFDRAVKRGFDLFVAGGAVLLLAPILGGVALLIKLDSRGPVLFKQTRIGRGNEMFKVLKFRSMRVETSDGAGHRSATRDDERVTRIGRLIRSSSIDELPQLFNVLRGNMSIVGPRPHAIGSRAADKLFWEVDRRYWHRHAAKPGLTGLAQVRGYRGATIEEADLQNRLQADLEYLERWSIWRDLRIIMLTFRVLLHRNAF